MFIIIEHLYHKDKQLYYKNPISPDLKPATIFNDKHIYFYKAPKVTANMLFLGKYKNFNFQTQEYEFAQMKVLKYDKNNIYSKFIPDDENNYELLEDMQYQGMPLYYIKN